jgi:hypothetical protein
MRLIVRTDAIISPYPVSPSEALSLHHRDLLDGQPFLLMAKDWRIDAEDDDYEELTSDELDDPEFLEDFAFATLELWL